MKKIISKKSSRPNYSLTIGWLYPELMNTYGDRGNSIVLEKRCEWRGITPIIKRISIGTDANEIGTCDILFMGGAQDSQQEIVNRDLFQDKGKILEKKILEGTPGMYICGAYQFLGEYYKTASGKILKGLGIFPCFTENPGKKTKRLIGNIVIDTQLDGEKSVLVGFENHGGRTYLHDTSLSLGTVRKGFGNNGEDGTEGILFHNSIGSYLHGPILPKNSFLADFLIQKAFQKKYKTEILLQPIDSSIENSAREHILRAAP